MKYLYTFALLILSFNTYADKYVSASCSKMIDYTLYSICYSYENKIPQYTEYSVTREIIEADILKKRPGFHQEKQVPKAYRASNKDYSKSGWDKGHLAPNSALNTNKVTQKELFTLANIAPQHKKLNRNLWSKLEKYVRYEALKQDLHVITALCYTVSDDYIGNNVRIPYAFIKVINFKDKTEIYFMKNEMYTTNDIKHYMVESKFVNESCTNLTIQ